MHLDDERLFALLGELDHAPPRVTARDVMSLAHARQRRRARRIAAAVVFTVAGTGVAYAAPGSPFREWVDAALSRATARDSDARPAAPAIRVGMPRVSGISIAPGARFTIEFTSHQTAGDVRVALTDAAEVSVTAAAGAASYTAGAERVEVDNRGGSASFNVALPRRAPRIDVVVAGRRVLTKIGGSVSGAGATVEGGRYVISLGTAP